MASPLLRSPEPLFANEPRFNGADYVPARDWQRLTNQLGRIWKYMLDQQWHTLDEIGAETGDPVASISAQLRHLRKERFGSHTVLRQHLGRGLYSYKVVPTTHPN